MTLVRDFGSIELKTTGDLLVVKKLETRQILLYFAVVQLTAEFLLLLYRSLIASSLEFTLLTEGNDM